MSASLTKRHLPSVALVSALICFGAPLKAAETAQNPPAPTAEQLVTAGQKLAKEKCAKCHSIAKQGGSPHKDAPPFRTFASKWPLSFLEESLAEGIVTGHEDMPEVVFSPKEIGEFLEFLGSLQKK